MVSSGFYDSLHGDRKYNIQQLSSMFDGLIHDGVYMNIGKRFQVTTSGSGFTVYVAEGRGWFNHSWIVNIGSLHINVDPADQVLDRIDAIVIDVNQSKQARKNDIVYVKGYAASRPTRPSMINSPGETHYQYPVAYIYVKAGATKITSSDIINEIGVETPFVTGILGSVSAEDLVTHWESQFEAKLNEMQSAIDTMLQSGIPSGTVSSTFKVTIKANNWKWDDRAGRWASNVSVSGILESDNPIIDLDLVLLPWANGGVDNVIDAWNPDFIETSAGYVKIWTRDKPDVDIPIKMLCIRK